MHVQSVSFTPSGIDEEGYLGTGSQPAPAIAEMLGLVAKLWLADPEHNAYGGVCLWRDRAAMESYTGPALLESVTAFPHFAELALPPCTCGDSLSDRALSVAEDMSGEWLSS